MDFFNRYILEAYNTKDMLKATTILFAVIDIIGSIPVIIKLKTDNEGIRFGRTSIVVLGIMLGFLILGESVLNIFGVSVEAFAVAGSLMLFALACEMIFGMTIFRDTISGKTASIVPLAFPIIAGAGTMTSLVSLRAEFEYINIVIAIFINVLIVYLVLKSIKRIEKALGEGGIAILKKVFGIILLAIAVKLFTKNLTILIAGAI
jgi:multiple antibiotic resistance protein